MSPFMYFWYLGAMLFKSKMESAHSTVFDAKLIKKMLLMSPRNTALLEQAITVCCLMPQKQLLNPPIQRRA